MEVFHSGANAKGVKTWGPMASTEVKVSNLKGGGNFIGETWVLADIAIAGKEICDVRQCFNDTSFIYALGNDQAQSEMSLAFIIFIGKGCDGKGGMDPVKKGIAAYLDSRVSQNGDIVTITIGGESSGLSIGGRLIGFEAGRVSPQDGIMLGTLHFLADFSTVSG